MSAPLSDSLQGQIQGFKPQQRQFGMFGGPRPRMRNPYQGFGGQQFQGFNLGGQQRPQFQQMQPGQNANRFGGGNQQFRQNQAAPSLQGAPNTLQAGNIPSMAEMQPFLGGAGKVKYDPFTGNLIDKKDRVSPEKYRNQMANEISFDLAQGPALKEASNFQFQNLPEVQGYLNQLQGATQNILGTGQQSLQQGQGLVGDSVNNILGTQGRMLSASEQSTMAKEQARQELADLQRQALSPDLDPYQRAFFQQRADERLSEISNLEGNLMDAFQRQRAGDTAQLAARGVLDSSTAGNVMGERERRLALDLNQLQREAGEISRQEVNKEREGIRGAAGQFGGLQAGQATGEGGLIAQLLGQSGQLGGTMGQLGLGQAGLGADLAKSGLSGMSQLGQLGLQNRGQEADLQQAALSTRMMGDQMQLQNLQSLINQILGRRATRQGMDLQQGLYDQYMGDQGGFLGIF